MIRAVSDKQNDRAASRRIEERRERRLSALKSLFLLVEKIGATSDVSEIASFLATFMEERQVKRASLYLVAIGRRRLEPQAGAGAAENGAPPFIPLESVFVRWVAEADGPVRLEEFDVDAGHEHAKDEDNPRSLVEAGFSRAVALAGREGLLGMLLYGGLADGDDARECDDELCGMLARAASIAIRNALINARTAAAIQDLERFSGAKCELVSGAAQDIRMPLAFLKNALWSLEPDRGSESVLVDMAKNEVVRLERKIEYVLSLNDIEPGARDFAMEPTEISSIVEDILREKLPELEEKQIHIDLDDRARFRKVRIDSGKLSVVIRSLIDSAVDAAERDGTVAVTIRVSEEPPGKEDGIALDDRRANAGDEADSGSKFRRRNADASSYLVIDVACDGIDLSGGDIGRLGSGLVISRKVVSGHGGRLLYKGDSGQGARFSVWLPLDV